MNNEELMIIGTFALLFWIGWELRRIANLIQRFVKGESVKANGNESIKGDLKADHELK